MRSLRREWFNISRTDIFRVIPLGDVHLGAAACDEKLLRKVVKRIGDDPMCYWIGLGDYCLSDDTEVLTDHGWKSVDTILATDRAVVYEPEQRACTFQPILKKWINVTNSDLIHLTSSHIDALVTSTHRVLVNHMVSGKWKRYDVVEAQRLTKGKTKHIWRLPVACCEWLGADINISPDWFALKGWIDTEGHLERVGNYERLQIAQSDKQNPDRVQEIDALLGRLGLRAHRSERSWGVVVWRFNGQTTKEIHAAIGRKGERIDWVMNAPKQHLKAYFLALMNGDGTWIRNCFAQKERALVDVFQELCFKLGYRARVTQDQARGMYFCHFGSRRGKHSLLRGARAIPYSGRTWCISTEAGFIVTRRNHKIVVLGNCEFINVHDKRFDVGTLANWIQMSDLADLARVQRARFLEIVEPIASRCLGLAKGNHEDSIARKFERDVYSEIVVGVKQAGGFADDYPLALGFYGWLLLNFYRTETRNRVTRLKVNVHHGFVGGRLAGAKALNMQRWLWTHDCDLAIFGHSHNTSAQPEAVESVDRSGNIVIQVRRGCYAGTFLRTVNDDGPSTYSEKRGYFPLPMGGAEVILRPGAMERNDMVRVLV